MTSRVMLRGVVLLLGAACAWAQPGVVQWDFEQPLRVCTASIQDFGARCNGAPHPSLEDLPQPIGSVPPEGWCLPNVDFCGYDVAVFQAVARDINLEEGKHYIHVCMGEKGFPVMIDDLAGRNRSLGQCDLGASTITASSDREAMGIGFSRATHRSSLAVMTYAPLKQRGKWAFMDPLHKDVWLAMLGTILVTPIFVFFFETIFSGRSMYADHHGHLSILHGLKEALWHSISHTLSIDVFKVNAFPSRLITVAYGFLVMIITNTYTANLAAFLTVEQLDTNINSVTDLRARAVATVQPYVKRLYDNHRLTTTDRDNWDYEQMITKLKAGHYSAIISDDVQLIPRAHQDEACSLHILDEQIEPFDLAIAYRRGFPFARLQTEISNSLLRLQEAGTLEEIKQDYVPPKPSCLESTEFSETNRVHVRALWGLWIILAAAVFLATVGALVHFFIVKRKKPEQQQLITARVKPFRDTFSSMMHVPSVPSVVEAFQSAGRSRRNRQHPSEAAIGSNVPSPSPSSRALWSNANSKLSASLRSSRVRNDSAVEALAVVTEGHEELPTAHGGIVGDDSGHLHTQRIKPEEEHVLACADESASLSPVAVTGPQAMPIAEPSPVESSVNGGVADGAWAGGVASRATSARGSGSGSGGAMTYAQPPSSGSTALARVALLRAARRTTDSSAATLESNDMLLPCMPDMGRPGSAPPSGPLLRTAGAPVAAPSRPGSEQAVDLRSELASLADLVRMVDDRVSALIGDAQRERDSSCGGEEGGGAAQ